MTDRSAAFGLVVDRLHDNRIVGLSTLLAVSCLAYFFMLDHVVFSSANFSPIFRWLLARYDVQSAWAAAIVCIAAAIWQRPKFISSVVEQLARHPVRVALVTTGAISLGAVFVYQNYPLSMDEYTAVFQAKTFAAGQWVAQLPAHALSWLVVSGFNGSFLIASSASGNVIEAYWPGFALILAAFEFVKVPWLCNASLAGLSILIIYWITKEITQDRRAPGWAMLFTLASGAFIANAISLYSMQAHLTANLVFVALLLKPTRIRALAAGLVGSFALNLHNPVPHALFAIPWVISLARHRRQWQCLLFLGLGYLPGLAIGFGWFSLRTDIESATHGGVSLAGIIGDAFALPGTALVNMRAAAVVKLLVWAPPGLFLFAVSGWLRHRENPHVRLLMQSAVLSFVGYVFVRFDQGHGWGYRYFHPAFGTIPILAACAMAKESKGQPRLIAFAGAAAILSLLITVPLQMRQIDQVIARHLAQIPQPLNPGNNIFFIHPAGGFYVADMVQIDPLLRDRNLLLVSRGAQLDARLVRENWPNAVKVFGNQASDQWYLGPEDQRIAIRGTRERQFVFKKMPSLPNAAGR